jgi:histidinol-phosphatase (PHP family)
MIPEYVKSAEIRGVTEIAFTTHLITIGPDTDLSIRDDEIPEYIEEIHKAQKETNVKLLAGLEVDYFPEEEHHLEKILSGHDFDFILGSTHTLMASTLALKDNRSVSFPTGPYPRR